MNPTLISLAVLLVGLLAIGLYWSRAYRRMAAESRARVAEMLRQDRERLARLYAEYGVTPAPEDAPSA